MADNHMLKLTKAIAEMTGYKGDLSSELTFDVAAAAQAIRAKKEPELTPVQRLNVELHLLFNDFYTELYDELREALKEELRMEIYTELSEIKDKYAAEAQKPQLQPPPCEPGVGHVLAWTDEIEKFFDSAKLTSL